MSVSYSRGPREEERQHVIRIRRRAKMEREIQSFCSQPGRSIDQVRFRSGWGGFERKDGYGSTWGMDRTPISDAPPRCVSLSSVSAKRIVCWTERVRARTPRAFPLNGPTKEGITSLCLCLTCGALRSHGLQVRTRLRFARQAVDEYDSSDDITDRMLQQVHPKPPTPKILDGSQNP